MVNMFKGNLSELVRKFEKKNIGGKMNKDAFFSKKMAVNLIMIFLKDGKFHKNSGTLKRNAKHLHYK